MIFFIVWLIGFLGSGAYFVLKMSGRSDTGFSTTDGIFLLSIVLMSLFWPISVVSIGIRKLRAA